MIGMTAPMVPAPAATTPAAPAAAQATEVTSDNFLLMLGQLLGAPVAQSTTKPVTAAQSETTDSEAEAATQDAALITGVPIPVVTTPIQSPAVAAGEAQPAAAITAARAGTVAADSAAAKELLRADEGSQPASNSNPAQPLALSATDMSQQLRVAASPDPGPQRTLHHSVGTSAWADELGTRMLLMSDRGQHSASLRLNPENLGPLEVRISVRDDQASVWFGASQSDTRAALEQALPRLRELFASQGLSLADTGVHHEAPRDQGKPQTTGGESLSGPGETEVTTATIAVKLGLVDAYA